MGAAALMWLKSAVDERRPGRGRVDQEGLAGF